MKHVYGTSFSPTRGRDPSQQDGEAFEATRVAVAMTSGTSTQHGQGVEPPEDEAVFGVEATEDGNEPLQAVDRVGLRERLG